MPESRPSVKFGRPLYRRLAAIRDQIAQELDRKVTLEQAVERMADRWEQTEQLLRDVKEHQP